MRALVTGGSGFVGANLVRRLLADGHEVHVLLRPGHAPWRLEEVRTDLRVHAVEVADPGVADVVAGVRPEWIFHLAAYGAYSSQTDVGAIVRTNVVGTVNLVEACMRAGFAAFVHTGSSSEYGFKDHAPAETEWLDPNSHYAVTKASATMFCRYTARSRKAALTTLRLYSAYGPWEEPTRLMPTLVLRGLAGTLPPLVNPDIARDYVHVDDVVEACVLAARGAQAGDGAIYNLGTGVQTTLREIVAIARGVLGVTAEPVWGTMPDRSWDTSVWVADARAIREVLGWAPRHDVEGGFREFVAWMRGRPDVLDFYRRQQVSAAR
jgi:dolichol-phosphate mannosyltransferase